jgi:predicted PurR-regulated permease PerM
MQGSGWAADVTFLRRVLIVAGVTVLALLLWRVRAALLLAFGGVVVAVLLLALAKPIERLSGMARPFSLATVGLGLAVLLGLAVALVGGQMRSEIAVLAEQLPRAAAVVEDRLGLRLPAMAGGSAPGELAQAFDASTIGSVLGRIASLGGMVVNALTAFVVAVVGGLFLAADPGLYRRGLIRLLPRARQQRAEDALVASGEALRLWLGAQLVSMAIIGVLVGFGTWVIGLPSPLALGLFAALAAFVPLIGAVAGAVPALLLALAQGADAFVWTGLLFIGVQQLESNMIMPLVERRMVSLPPALLVFAVVAVGLLFGLPGVILAAPITVVAFVMVKMLYVRDTLGQPTEIPGEDR